MEASQFGMEHGLFFVGSVDEGMKVEPFLIALMVIVRSSITIRKELNLIFVNLTNWEY